MADGALNPIVFCGRCGAYGRRQIHLLGKECDFQKRRLAAQRLAGKALDSLWAGQDPRRGKFWGLPFPFRLLGQRCRIAVSSPLCFKMGLWIFFVWDCELGSEIRGRLIPGPSLRSRR